MLRCGSGGSVELVGARKILENARIFALCFALSAGSIEAFAQAPTAASPQPAPAADAPPALPAGVTPPPGYVIGPDDQLAVIYWREKDLSADVVVRPDGLISLPLLNDVAAAGLTPEQLRVIITRGATKFLEDPTVSVVVKAINSRKVFITGMIARPGPYPLAGPTSVLQLIATAGGVAEYANKKKIVIVREENGKEFTLRFNYNDVMKGKNLAQNIDLKPGDSIIVP